MFGLDRERAGVCCRELSEIGGPGICDLLNGEHVSRVPLSENPGIAPRSLTWIRWHFLVNANGKAAAELSLKMVL